MKEYEKQIDELVYKLYELTPEEIKIIENNDKEEIVNNFNKFREICLKIQRIY